VTAVASARLKIGMEVHVELATRTRLFSRTASVAHRDHFDAPPNSLIDPVVLGLPGALPVMNRAAVEHAMLVGLALNCQIAHHSRWDRKNYFYPDLPKGYQISQYDLPLCFDGGFDVVLSGGAMRKVGIIRAHLEEDAGKLGHELPGGGRYDGSLVDYNRAGTPLLEIVSAPDLTSADEAVAYAQELRTLCRFLGVSEAIMQRGHMRFEPNINVIIDTRDGREFATPVVEVKNLNSFKSLHGAIEFEFKRQIEQWQADGQTHGPGQKTTRGWDDAKQCTFLQRSKEDEQDYRYFPDPDLPPVHISEVWMQEVRARLPELPAARRGRYQRDYGLSLVEAATLTAERDVTEFYQSCIEAFVARRERAAAPLGATQAAKWLLNAGAKRANERGVTIDQLGITPAHIAAIIDLRERGAVGSGAADELFGLLCEPALAKADVETLARERGLLAVRDEAQVQRWIDEAIAAQPQAAADFVAGKEVALGRLVGHVMKLSKGQADAAAVQASLRQRLRR